MFQLTCLGYKCHSQIREAMKQRDCFHSPPPQIAAEKTPTLYFRIRHSTLCLLPKFRRNHRFQMLFRTLHIPKSI